MFPDDATAEKWFTDVRWPDGIYCPHCGSGNVQTGAKHKTMPLRCRNYKECGKKFSVRTETAMEGSNLGFQVWAIAIYLLSTSRKSVSLMRLHQDLDVSKTTAWYLAHRIRESFGEDDQNSNGVVEGDESYFGGFEKNKRWNKKLNERRVAVGKIEVASPKDRDANQVTAKIIENTKRGTLHGFIKANVVKGLTFCTEGFKSNRNMQGYNHHFGNHNVGEYLDANVHVNGMEIFWSILKRAPKGTFHDISHKHMNWYVTKFARQRNYRPLNTIEQIKSIVLGLVGK